MDLSDMGAGAVSRQLIVSGEKDANVNIQVFNNSGSFYDFTTKSFTSGFSSSKNINVNLTGNNFIKNINFPATSGATYTVFLYSTPDSDTEFSKLSGAHGKHMLKKSITQVGNAVLTLAPTNAGSGMKTMPTTTLTASATESESTDIEISWTIENVETDANGFGLRLIRQPIDTDWYFQTTETVNGAITSSTQVIVDDLTDIGIGMVITAVSSGSLSGTPTITVIDVDTKTLTLSVAQTFADGITLTMQARGTVDIQRAIGLGLHFNRNATANLQATTTALTKTVRANSSGTTIDLNGTYGIAGGGHVVIKGLGVNNSSTNTVQSVSASSGAGGVVMQLDQTGVLTGSTISFGGSTRIVTLTGIVTSLSYPSSNREINLNLDNFITLGAAS